jgi:hypothetical protein
VPPEPGDRVGRAVPHRVSYNSAGEYCSFKGKFGWQGL